VRRLWLGAVLLLCACDGSNGGGNDFTVQNGKFKLTVSGGSYKSGTLEVNAPHASLTLVSVQEGASAGSDCTYATSRRQIDLMLTGPEGTATIADQSQMQGSGCDDTTMHTTPQEPWNVARNTTSGGSGLPDPTGTWELDLNDYRVNQGATFTYSAGHFSGHYFDSGNDVEFSGSLDNGHLSATASNGVTLSADPE
jgi:hypothetical protein